MYEYCVECNMSGFSRMGDQPRACRTYKDVEGSTYEDCEQQLALLGWVHDDLLGWICPKHNAEEIAEFKKEFIAKDEKL